MQGQEQEKQEDGKDVESPIVIGFREPQVKLTSTKANEKLWSSKYLDPMFRSNQRVWKDIPLFTTINNKQ